MTEGHYTMDLICCIYRDYRPPSGKDRIRQKRNKPLSRKLRGRSDNGSYALYVEAEVFPPSPVQLVWKKVPLG